MRIFRLIPSLTLLLILNGCGTTQINYQQRLSSTTACCTHFHTIKYRALTYKKPVQQHIGGKKSAARQFPEGKSFFMALKLPAYSSAYELQIESNPHFGQLFIPKVLLLNEHYQVVKTISADTFKSSNGTLNHNLFVNQDLGYRHMILYTTPAQLKKESSTRMASTNSTYLYGGGYGLNLQMGNDSKTKIKATPGGQVTVSIKKYSPRTLQ